jgi:tRNA (guanine-N7-)-methyltransferase
VNPTPSPTTPVESEKPDSTQALATAAITPPVAATTSRQKQSRGDAAHPKDIKSFVRRAGRTTSGQAKALEEIGPKVLLPFVPNGAENAINSVAVRACWTGVLATFPSKIEGIYAPVVLEIGFGMGEATAQIAATLPDTNFLCCEVHEPGVGALLKRIGEQHLGNIRILAHDAVEVIDHMLPLDSLDGVHIFFPDPWHKKRHNKRRLIQQPLIAKLAARLKPGAYLHCATDWEPYAEQILAVLSAEPLLQNTVPTDLAAGLGYAPKPFYRPLTKFENRGIKLGHGVWDIVFKRVAD